MLLTQSITITYVTELHTVDTIRIRLLMLYILSNIYYWIVDYSIFFYIASTLAHNTILV